MRWNVQGTDVATGQNLMLGVDAPEAAQAVQAALDRRIVVTAVTAEARRLLFRALFPLTIVALVIVSGFCVAMYVTRAVVLSDRDAALLEQSRLADSLSQAEGMVNELRRSGHLASGAASQARQLSDELAAARNRMSRNEQQLSAAHNQLEALQTAAQQVPDLQTTVQDLKHHLAEADARNAALHTQIAMQDQRFHELEALTGPDSAQARNAAALAQNNRELVVQIEALKAELLATAATAPAPAPPPAAADALAARWALRTSYDSAADFLRLHFDKDSLATNPTADGALASSGALTANAATLRILHDRAKERVYSATLCISLAPDGPRDKLTENARLAADFVRTFAPGFGDAQNAISAAVRQLADKDDQQQLVFLGSDGRLTIWNNRLGMYALRIDAPRAGQDE